MKSRNDAVPSMRVHKSVPLCVVLAVACGVLSIGLGAATSLATEEDMSEAKNQYVEKNYERALQILDRLLEEGPTGSVSALDIQVWRAKCLVQKGDDEAALEAFCRVRKLAPDWRPEVETFEQNELDLFRRASSECVVGPAKLSITSDPPGAHVWLDGTPVGDTPIEDLLREAGTCSLTVKIEGYHDHEELINVTLPATSINVQLKQRHAASTSTRKNPHGSCHAVLGSGFWADLQRTADKG